MRIIGHGNFLFNTEDNDNATQQTFVVKDFIISFMGNENFYMRDCLFEGVDNSIPVGCRTRTIKARVRIPSAF